MVIRLLPISLLLLVGCAPAPERYGGMLPNAIVQIEDVNECSYEEIWVSDYDQNLKDATWDVSCIDSKRYFHCEWGWHLQEYKYQMVCEEYEPDSAETQT